VEHLLLWQPNGRDKKRKLLGDTWQLIEDPSKFERYIETEIGTLLEEAGARPPAS
jgi:hypothetical protein